MFLSLHSLLVLGLEQFKSFEDPEHLVVEHMLPTKTVQQLKHHVKNSTKKGLSNVITVSQPVATAFLVEPWWWSQKE